MPVPVGIQVGGGGGSGTETPATIVLTGDVTGKANDNTVVRIQNHTVTSTTPGAHQGYFWTNTTHKLVPTTLPMQAGTLTSVQVVSGETRINATGAMAKPYYLSGAWYGDQSNTGSSLTPTLGRIYFIRFNFSNFTAKAMGLYLNSGSTITAVSHLGIYNDNGHCIPSSRILTVGTKSSSTATITLAITPSQFLLQPCWLAILVTGSAAIRPRVLATTFTTGYVGIGAPTLAQTDSPLTTATRGYQSVATTFSTLPATAPAVATLTVETGPNLPALFLQSA